MSDGVYPAVEEAEAAADNTAAESTFPAAAANDPLPSHTKEEEVGAEELHSRSEEEQRRPEDDLQKR